MANRLNAIILKRLYFAITIYDRINDLRQTAVSDEYAIKKQFRKMTGRKVELQDPVRYTDKLQWLKLNWRSDFVSTLLR